MKINQLALTTIVFLLLIGFESSAQQPDFEWANQLGSGEDDRGHAIAIDASGNVYTAGRFRQTIDFDPGTGINSLSSNGGSDIFVQKLNDSGNLVWAKNIGGTNHDHALAIAVDYLGNVYLTGKFRETVDFDPGPGVFNLTANGNDDIYILKLNASGDFVWANSMGGSEIDRGRAITADKMGNVYTTGYFGETVDFDPGPGITNLNSIGDRDIFIQKLDPSGNFLWAVSMGGSGFDAGVSIKTDTLGYVFTIGHFEASVDFDPGLGNMDFTSAGDRDIFIQKLNPDGNLIWAKQIGGNGDDNPYSLTLDVSGNIHTTGFFETTVDFDPGAGSFNLNSLGGNDAFVQKLDTIGNLIWVKQIGGGSDQTGRSIALDKWGAIYITGYFQGTTDFDPGIADFNLNSNGETDIFVQKLTSWGDFVWAKQMGGAGQDRGYALAVDPFLGTVYTSGFFEGIADFDPEAGTMNLNSTGEEDIFQLKLSQCIVQASIFVENGLEICQGDSSTLTAACGLNYAWSTGESTTSIEISPSSSTIYTVTVSNSSECTASAFVGILVNDLPHAEISGDFEICEGESTTLTASGGSDYIWSTDQTAETISIAPSANMAYIVTVTDANGCTNSATAIVNVETAPTAQFDFIINGGDVDFNNLSSINSNTFDWDFGDGIGSTASDPSHEYTQSGIYDVQLIAFGDCGSDTIIISVEVDIIVPLSAAFSLDHGTGCAPLLVQFTDQSLGQVDGWNWSFPGGAPNSSTNQNPQVIYQTPGIYDVSLEISNAGGSNEITIEDYIIVEPTIFAGFDYSVEESVVTFTNTTQNVIDFQWDFGDNSPLLSLENPVHEYSLPGVYLVTLVATNPLCGGAITQTVDVIFTNIDSIEDENTIELYPNPTGDVLNIRSNLKIDRIQISNILGQQVLEITEPNEFEKINVGHFPSGIYVVLFKSGEQIWTMEFVKQ